MTNFNTDSDSSDPGKSTPPDELPAKPPTDPQPANVRPKKPTKVTLEDFVKFCYTKEFDIGKTMAAVRGYARNYLIPQSDNDLEQAVNNILSTLTVHPSPMTIELAQETEQSKNSIDLNESMEVDLDVVVRNMNATYAFLTKDTWIVKLSDCSLQSEKMMKARYKNTFVLGDENKRGKPDSHFDAWFKSPDRRKHIGITFQPGKGPITDNMVNRWTSWGAIPKAGDVTPWVRLLDHLFDVGSTDRKWIEQWLAYPLQNPGAKLATAVLIWSQKHGVGKSMLGEAVRRIYGTHGKTVSAPDINDRNNGWIPNTLFAVCEEYSNTSGRKGVSDKLKVMITEPTMMVNEKYIQKYSTQNLMNLLLLSNHADALPIDEHDRRFGVFSIESDPLPGSFYTEFANWSASEAGLGALMGHLLNVDMSGFDPNARAPMSEAKLSMIKAGKPALDTWVADMLSDEYIDNHLRAEIVTLPDLLARFHDECQGTKSQLMALIAAIRRQNKYSHRRVSHGDKRLFMISVRNHAHWDGQSPSAWTTEYLKGRSPHARLVP